MNPSFPRRSWLALAAIYIAVAAAYFPALRGGLLWDDDAHVTRPELQSWVGLGQIWSEVGATQQYYPVLHSAFWVEHRLWGDATLGYHLVNVLLHATAACLVIVLLRRLAVPGAWLAGLIFALHPVEVESVAWISEQKNTLSAVFYLWAALAYLRFDETRRRPSYVWALGFFVLALLSKSVTATLPAALLVVFWWRRGRLSWRGDVVPLLPFFATGAVAGLFTAWVERHLLGAEGADYALGGFARCLLAGRVAWFYLGKLLWPANLTFIYPRWTVSAASPGAYVFPLAALAVLAVFWRIRRRTRGPLAVALFFLGTLFPALGFFNAYPFRYSFVADHFQYLASVGIFAGTAGMFCHVMRDKNSGRIRLGGLALAAGLAGLLAIMTWRQTRMYRDLPTLYRATIARNPECWMAYGNLGSLLLAEGQAAEAFVDLRRAVEINPDFPEGQFNLGNALRAQGNLAEAVVRYRAALRLKPGYPEAEDNLGTALFSLGRPNEAIAHYRAALALRPDYPGAEVNLGAALQPTQPGEAIACYDRALRLDPDNFAAHYNLGRVLLAIGRPGEGLVHYEAACRLHPGDAALENTVGIAQAQAGHLPEAIAHFERAVQLQPNYREAHYNLSLALRDAGRPAEALEQSRQALGLRP